MTRRRRRAAAAALALALLALGAPLGCRARRAPARGAPATGLAVRARSAPPAGPDALRPVPLASVLAALPAAPAIAPDALAAENAREFPPGVPPGCELLAPVRTLTLRSAADRAHFVTAVGPTRALLSLATRPAVPTADDGDAGDDGGESAPPADAATWILGDAPDGAVRFARGPVPPDANTAVAAAARDTLLVAWSRPGDDERTAGAIGLAAFPPPPRGSADASAHDAPPPAVVAVAAEPAPLVTDLVCDSDLCAIAYGWVDRYAPPALADRAALRAFDPTRLTAPGPPLVAPEAHRPFTAFGRGPDQLVGSALREGGALALVRADGVALPLAIPPDASVLDVARAGSTLFALLARAPGGNTRCQPQRWTLELYTVTLDGALRAQPVPVATLDARPVGARIRAVGPADEPLVSWVDAPQCNERFSVVRAYHRGRVAALASAQEYDVATSGGRLSIALRDHERIRWILARCAP